MTDIDRTEKTLHPLRNPLSRLQRSARENWTTSVFREELAILESLSTGRRQVPNYVLESETQYQFKDPKLKSIQYLRHIEQNVLGRYAYTPVQMAPTGIIPAYDDKPYPEVIPRFHLPKMPF